MSNEINELNEIKEFFETNYLKFIEYAEINMARSRLKRSTLGATDIINELYLEATTKRLKKYYSILKKDGDKNLYKYCTTAIYHLITKPTSPIFKKEKSWYEAPNIYTEMQYDEALEVVDVQEEEQEYIETILDIINNDLSEQDREFYMEYYSDQDYYTDKKMKQKLDHFKAPAYNTLKKIGKKYQMSQTETYANMKDISHIIVNILKDRGIESPENRKGFKPYRTAKKRNIKKI